MKDQATQTTIVWRNTSIWGDVPRGVEDLLSLLVFITDVMKAIIITVLGSVWILEFVWLQRVGLLEPLVRPVNKIAKPSLLIFSWKNKE